MAARPTLAELLARASPASRVEFVAALYGARGVVVAVDGPVVSVSDERVLVAPDSQTVFARLHTRLRPPHDPVDRVFALDEARATRLANRYDATPLTPSDLDRLARYGLERDVADDLFERSFGRSVAAVAPAEDDAETRDIDTFPMRRLSLVAVIVLLVAGFGTGGFDIGAGERGLSVGGLGTTGTALDAPAPVSNPTETPVAGETDPETSSTPLAPGISQAGVTDIDALAAAHEAALANRSYRWELSYVERVNGTVTARGTELVAVHSPNRFVSTVAWTADPVGFSPVASHSSYADGTHRYRPADDGSGVASRELNAVSQAGEQGWRSSRAIRWYLSAAPSSLERTLIHAQTPTVVLVANGTRTSPALDAYQVRAHVTSEGLVQSLSVSYVLSARDGRPSVEARFTFRYRLDEDVSAPSPPWYVVTDAPPSSSRSPAVAVDRLTRGL